MNDVVTQDGRQLTHSPPGGGVPAHLFARAPSPHINAGAVEVESNRAIAEAQAAFVVAQRFQRDEMLSYQRFMASCSRPSFAERAFFRYSRGGKQIEGPSIRFAEEAARCFRNFQYGMLELSNKDGVTEMQAFAHDWESNVRTHQNFTVRHLRDKNSGPAQELTSERDIYEIGANMGSRRMRARILALLPADYVEDGIARCKETLERADSAMPITERIKAMMKAFDKIGVTSDMLVQRLGHPLDKTTPQELDELRGVLTAIKEGVTSVADEFSAGHFQAKQESSAANAVAAATASGGDKRGGASRKASSTATSAPEATQEATEDKTAAAQAAAAEKAAQAAAAAKAAEEAKAAEAAQAKAAAEAEKAKAAATQQAAQSEPEPDDEDGFAEDLTEDDAF